MCPLRCRSPTDLQADVPGLGDGVCGTRDPNGLTPWFASVSYLDDEEPSPVVARLNATLGADSNRGGRIVESAIGRVARGAAFGGGNFKGFGGGGGTGG